MKSIYNEFSYAVTCDWNSCALLVNYSFAAGISTKRNYGFSEIFQMDTIKVLYGIRDVLNELNLQ